MCPNGTLVAWNISLGMRPNGTLVACAPKVYTMTVSVYVCMNLCLGCISAPHQNTANFRRNFALKMQRVVVYDASFSQLTAVLERVSAQFPCAIFEFLNND